MNSFKTLFRNLVICGLFAFVLWKPIVGGYRYVVNLIVGKPATVEPVEPSYIRRHVDSDGKPSLEIVRPEDRADNKLSKEWSSTKPGSNAARVLSESSIEGEAAK